MHCLPLVKCIKLLQREGPVAQQVYSVLQQAEATIAEAPCDFPVFKPQLEAVSRIWDWYSKVKDGPDVLGVFKDVQALDP